MIMISLICEEADKWLLPTSRKMRNRVFSQSYLHSSAGSQQGIPFSSQNRIYFVFLLKKGSGPEMVNNPT